MVAKALYVMSIILSLGSLFVIWLAMEDMKSIKRTRRLLDRENQKRSKQMALATNRLRREQALTQMLSQILFDLAHADSKQTLRWKLHVIRKAEPLFGIERSDHVYDMIMDTLGKHNTATTREEFLDELRLATMDYHMMDLDEGRPLVDLMKLVMDYNVEMEDDAKMVKNLTYRVSECARALDLNFAVTNVNPLGELPDSRIARIMDDGPLSREQMLERMIAIANQVAEDQENEDRFRHGSETEQMPKRDEPEAYAEPENYINNEEVIINEGDREKVVIEEVTQYHAR